MRHKRLKLCTVLLLGLGLTGLQAQTIFLKENSGNQTTYALNSIHKMTFSNGNITVHKTNNGTDVYTLSELRYLSFIDLITSNTTQSRQLSEANIITYPNPVSDKLSIDLNGLTGNAIISILTLEGKLLKEQKTNGTNTVILNLHQLPQGIYLCRYSSITEIKTVKIIKQ